MEIECRFPTYLLLWMSTFRNQWTKWGKGDIPLTTVFAWIYHSVVIVRGEWIRHVRTLVLSDHVARFESGVIAYCCMRS